MRLDRQQGSFLLAVAAFVFAAMAFGVQCQSAYRTSVWREECDARREKSEEELVGAIRELRDTIQKL